MTFRIEVLTLFPAFFESPLASSILSRAIEREQLAVRCTDIRDYTTDKHRTTDDVPYGGGAGMVMKCEPTVAALEAARERNPEALRVYMTPQGERLTQRLSEELADAPGLILLCGHYEGVDERVREGWIDREVSIGDYVLTGGEPAALVLLDSVVRLLPGVLGNPESIEEESFQTGLIEHPHYTRPRSFRGMEVPEVLLSGHHGKIAEWRHQQSVARTRTRRPDLLDDSEE